MKSFFLSKDILGLSLSPSFVHLNIQNIFVFADGHLRSLSLSLSLSLSKVTNYVSFFSHATTVRSILYKRAFLSFISFTLAPTFLLVFHLVLSLSLSLSPHFSFTPTNSPFSFFSPTKKVEQFFFYLESFTFFLFYFSTLALSFILLLLLHFTIS